MKTHPNNNSAQVHNPSGSLIPLREAVKYCRYSQDYLSLRARQGKLKAVKIGRDWLTTKAWVKEYGYRIEKRKTKNKRRNAVAARKIDGFMNYKRKGLKKKHRLRSILSRWF